NISPAGNTTLKAGEEASFTCEHVLVVGDEPLYTNVASIEGAGKTEGSNEVEVEVGPKPAAAFTIEKEQRIEGQGVFTKEKLKAEVGQTVEYGITVLNTGNTTIEFGPLSDAKCANI